MQVQLYDINGSVDLMKNWNDTKKYNIDCSSPDGSGKDNFSYVHNILCLI